MGCEKLFNSGVLTEKCKGAILPPKDLWEKKKGGLVVIECPQRIPCNPCHTGCPTGAVTEFADINDQPSIDYSKCTGCGLCIAKCPGLACFVVDLTFAADRALVKLPYEMMPIPKKGDIVSCLNRVGEAVTEGVVENITEPWKDSTKIIHVSIDKKYIDDVRAVRVVK